MRTGHSPDYGRQLERYDRAVRASRRLVAAFGYTRGGETIPVDEAERIGYLSSTVVTYGMSLLSLLLAPVIIYGAVQMMRAKKYRSPPRDSRHSSVYVVLFPAGIPMGIWALIILQTGVKAAFNNDASVGMITRRSRLKTGSANRKFEQSRGTGKNPMGESATSSKLKVAQSVFLQFAEAPYRMVAEHVHATATKFVSRLSTGGQFDLRSAHEMFTRFSHPFEHGAFRFLLWWLFLHRRLRFGNEAQLSLSRFAPLGGSLP